MNIFISDNKLVFNIFIFFKADNIFYKPKCSLSKYSIFFTIYGLLIWLNTLQITIICTRTSFFFIFNNYEFFIIFLF
uniref:Ribosomal protein S3 n=1 Tax=Vickermania ingenoplastis TaxID=2720891 RepID=A0A873A2A5_9TRYP|nr:ribosomal protein S3 [Vickermania ingenoplastis]UGV20234.1 Ribosomal protein S3 [Vickermania ingenoplastis]